MPPAIARNLDPALSPFPTARRTERDDLTARARAATRSLLQCRRSARPKARWQGKCHPWRSRQSGPPRLQSRSIRRGRSRSIAALDSIRFRRYSSHFPRSRAGRIRAGRTRAMETGPVETGNDRLTSNDIEFEFAGGSTVGRWVIQSIAIDCVAPALPSTQFLTGKKSHSAISDRGSDRAMGQKFAIGTMQFSNTSQTISSLRGCGRRCIF